ncbi:MAG: NFACT RNA binding domain-containing protein [Cyclobacteriaceae bacterium]
MYHNYFFLKRLAPALHSRLNNLELVTCFSQSKDELVLGFASENDQCYLLANLSSQVGLIEIKNNFSRAKKNSVNLFSSFIGKKVSKVDSFNNERSFYIDFQEDLRLTFKMHGTRSNLIASKNADIIDVFRHNLAKDLSIDINNLDVSLEFNFDQFEKVEGELLQFNPTLGKEVRSMLIKEGYQSANLDLKWKLYNAAITMLAHNNPKIFETKEEKPYLVFWDTEDKKIFESSDIIETNNQFFRASTYYHHVKKLQNQLLSQIDADIKKTQNYLTKSELKFNELLSKRNHEEMANILMANLYNIPKRSKKIVLDDLYHENDKVEIKLNPDLSPQKNAENYYRKAKNQKKEFDNLSENIEARKKDLTHLLLRREQISEAEDHKSLRNLDKNISTRKGENEILPYKKITFEGFDIFVGKNAKSNDQLTLKVANKDDLWLHAKDVSGSHVIVKQQPGKNFPKDVIEYAASIAAGHSKRKNDSLCPVIYTLKKYIRKRKGDPAGAVVVEREEILMVEPLLNF